MKHEKYELFGELNLKQVLPFTLITCCFVLWGFTNDMTSALTTAFSRIFAVSASEGGIINGANSLGYLVMAIPAAIFIQRHKFKTGVLVGLCIYAVGAFLFFPSKFFGTITPFLFAYFVMACGMAFLETSCIPMVYSMGSEESGIGRLNMAQAFNALGATIGMFVVHDFVLAGLKDSFSAARDTMTQDELILTKSHDLSVLIQPYIFVTAIIVLLAVLIWMQPMKLPNDHTDNEKSLRERFMDIIKVHNFRDAVITEFFYTGAQVCCWAYIIQYGVRIFMIEGISSTDAEMLSQKYNIAAVVLFAASRFICTWLLKYLNPEQFLSVMAITAMTFTVGAILFTDRNGLYCLMGVSACMSLMFPTINGIGLRGMSQNLKLASAGFTMAIFGGAVFPFIQAVIIDSQAVIFGLPSTNISFIVPLLCFIVVALFGHRAYIRQYIARDYDQ